MKRSISQDMSVHTLPIHADWTLVDMWKLDDDAPRPDGEPMGWGNVLQYKDKVYTQVDDCECEDSIIETGKVCDHWEEIR